MALIRVMTVDMVEATVLALVPKGERLQEIGPSQVLFPFDLHQDIRVGDEERV